MRKLTKAHFIFLANKINMMFIPFEKVHLEDLDNKIEVSNFAKVMLHVMMANNHQTQAVASHINFILDNIVEVTKDKEYKHFNHSFNCFMKHLCVALAAQNKAFNETQFRKACTKGSIQ